jgi:hypothetical protein
MINLLPPHAQKKVQIEYWIRVCSVWIFLLGVACIIVGSLLVPSLVLVQSQLKVYSGEYQNASSQNDLYENLEQEVRVANDTAAHLVSSDKNVLFSSLISEVEEVADRTVLIKSISLSRTKELVESIQISGEAVSRSALVEFRDELESSPLFISAALPLSNLAKDKDVPFSITIVINNEPQE